MFSLPSDPSALYGLFHNQGPLFPVQCSPYTSKFTPPRQKNSSSGKKLNFDDDNNDVLVSDFNFGLNEESSKQPKLLMEIEEETPTPHYLHSINNEPSTQTPLKSRKDSYQTLQVTVPPRPEKKSSGSKDQNQKNNQNIIGLWRNDHHQVFKGKFSSGATPKLSKDFKAPDTPPPPTHNLKANKKIKKSLFHTSVPPKNLNLPPEQEACKENLGDCGNMALELDLSFDHTPSPKNKGYKDHFNTMSIKKERKIFNKLADLDDEEGCEEDPRFMTTCKRKVANSQELSVNSRFVNDYEIIEVIGSGCFGTVYKCLNKFDNMVYAIKCTKNRIKGTKTRHLSLHEAQALASFSSGDECSYIVRYYNAWIEDERLYLVMEHCNYSLKYLKQDPNYYFSESQIRHILRDIAEGLKSLHKRNVVHLDIKPDLGLSRIAKRSKGEEISEGDSRYLAPELLLDINDGNLPDLTKADIFSLGVTLYELMTKENIPSNGEEWHRIRHLDLPRLHQLDNYSETLKKLVISMMNPAPVMRPSADQLLVSDFLKTETEMELKWERTQNQLLKEQIREYESILKIKRKKSF